MIFKPHNVRRKSILILIMLSFVVCAGRGYAQEDKEALNKGIDYFSNGMDAEAITEFTKAIEINPNNAEAYNARGIVYHYIGKYDQAIADYTKAVQVDPTHNKAYYNLGFIYSSMSNYDQAVTYFTKAIQAKPDYTEAYKSRAIAYFAKNEYDKAWEDVHKVESLGDAVKPEFLEKLKKASGREK
jgi:tetratricopeptide (TPR) repeat protein